MATLRSRGEEKRASISPISANANWFMNFRYIGMERKGYYPNHRPSTINRSSAALCQAKNKTFLLGKMVRILRKRPFHRKSWITMLRIKIPCLLGTVQDLPSTWLVQEAWLCSRCAAELWIVNWMSCTLQIYHMHARDLVHTSTARVSCTQSSAVVR